MLQCQFQSEKKTAVFYRRCSTAEQRKSSLGLEAQASAVEEFCDREGFEITHTFTEAMSGRKDDRPELAKALKTAKENGSFVVVAKLCRLSRRVSYISKLMESGVPFIVSELGKDVDPMVMHMFAAFAESEAARISRRTKEALAIKKAQGFQLGGPNLKEAQANSRKVRTASADAFALDMKPLIDACLEIGMTTTPAIAKHLNEIQKPTQRGNLWTPAGVGRLKKRLERLRKERSDEVHNLN